MKKIKYLLLLMLAFPSIVLASGSYSASAPSSITNGDNATFTFTISNTAAWNLKLSGSGSTSGCSQNYADVTSDGKNTTRTFTLTCKSLGEGNIVFTATGDITSSDGTNSNVSISKTVKVIAKSSTQTTPSSTQTSKDSESRLSSLSIKGYKINFDKNKTSYYINVDSSVKSINISAKAVSSKATISGTGKKSIGSNGEKIKIICTAENGNKKTYTINISIVDNNPINIKIDENNYTIIKSSNILTAPSNSISSTTEIEGKKIPTFTNEQANIVIVGLKDNNDDIKYAIYDNGTYKLYNEVKTDDTLLYISSKNLEGYNQTTININSNEYIGYELETDDRYKIIYAMNLYNGEYNYYKYDTLDETFQYFDEKADIETNDDVNDTVTKVSLIVLAIISVYFILIKLGTKRR